MQCPHFLPSAQLSRLFIYRCLLSSSLSPHILPRFKLTKDLGGVYGYAGVTFHYHMFGVDIGTLDFETSPDGSSFSTIWSLTGQQQTSMSDPWRTAEIFVPTASITTHFRIKVTPYLAL